MDKLPDLGIDYTARASIGLTKRIPSAYVRLGSKFHPREQPARQVMVPEFMIAHVPVMVSQYQVFMQSGGPDEREWWSEQGWAWRQGEIDGWGRSKRSHPDGWNKQKHHAHHPVTGVTWYEAEAYCNWIRATKAVAARLPREEEWERAARGEDTRPFPWGEEFQATYTNTLETDQNRVVDVGKMTGDQSPFGIYDMAGNVQEWTLSPYAPLPDEAFPNAPLYAVRGGSYNDTAFGARTTYRRGYPAGYFYPFLGFRIAIGIK